MKQRFVMFASVAAVLMVLLAVPVAGAKTDKHVVTQPNGGVPDGPPEKGTSIRPVGDANGPPVIVFCELVGVER
jgi:hypothetical protein